MEISDVSMLWLYEREIMYNPLLYTIHSYLGIGIQAVVGKYYRKRIDLETEYVEIVKFIARKLIGDIIDYRELGVLEKELRDIVEQNIDKLLVSYLVSEYIESKKKKKVE